MARIRTIKPEFFMSEDIGSLTVSSRLLYVALWLHADKGGIIKFAPTSLAAQCMPFEFKQFDACFDELCASNLVRLYEVDGKKYVDIPTFKEHQRPHHTEKESGYPLFNGELTVNKRQERKGREGKGRERKGKGIVASDDDDSSQKYTFDTFYSAYPVKKGKQQAIKSWSKLSNADQILAVEETQSFIAGIAEGINAPHPSTYLNNKRWEDEVTVVSIHGKVGDQNRRNAAEATKMILAREKANEQ